MGISQVIRDAGFDCVGRCDASALRVMPEVREMCASGKCHVYGTNWACPPYCGELDDFRSAFAQRDACYVVQTVMDLEDEFDGETMMEASAVHGRRMREVVSALEHEDVLVLAAGTCSLCSACSCPDASCRFPDQRLSSMEAAGLMVNEVCIAAGIPYNHGPNKIAYTGCVMV